MKNTAEITVRAAELMDGDAVWSVIEPVIRAGETYALPRDMTRLDGLKYWFSEEHEVFVACEGDKILGTYFLKSNHLGGGSHVANAGYITAANATGRGVAKKMLDDSLQRALARGFSAMQFNFVISSNESAVRLWQKNGFAIVGTLPGAFRHPHLGFVDAYVMFRKL